jgi:hypothetical protein
LGALATRLLHACSDDSKIVDGAGSGALAAQLLNARTDHRKIVSSAEAGHLSSVSWRTANTTFYVKRGRRRG